MSWRNAFLRIFKRPRDPEVEEDQQLRWPELRYLAPADIEAVLAGATSFADPELEIALRRDYWRERNNRRRWDNTPAGQSLPLDEPERENLSKLLALLNNEAENIPHDDAGGEKSTDLEWRTSKCWLEIGEIQRELSLFDEALVSLALVGESHSSEARQLIDLARRRQAQLVAIKSS